MANFFLEEVVIVHCDGIISLCKKMSHCQMVRSAGYTEMFAESKSMCRKKTKTYCSSIIRCIPEGESNCIGDEKYFQPDRDLFSLLPSSWNLFLTVYNNNIINQRCSRMITKWRLYIRELTTFKYTNL